MSGFDPRFIEELKSKNDIVEVIGKYVRLEQRGDKFWGCCPFHHEKTGSFCVNAREQYYYCFGCKKTGDVVEFISQIESLDFNDAIKFLAERVKMPLPDVKIDDEKIRQKRHRRERLLSCLKDTAKFYVHNLYSKGGDKFIDYAYSRKLTQDTLTKFGIGASVDYDGLPTRLAELGYTQEEMLLSGVCRVTKDNRAYDALACRFIIPIIDQFSNVIAFTGRKLDESIKGGKYVNTAETEIFSKRNSLFNLNNLKRIRNDSGLDKIIMVEGHMDVVSLSQAGITNVVASMGTALTKEQARILKRYSNKVFICYDGDFAGQSATIRGLEILRDEGLDVKVVNLPEGMDPDEVVSKMGVDAYTKFVDDALPLIDFKLENLKRSYNIKTIDGKRKFTANAIKVIRESSSPTEQEDLLKRVRDLTGTTYESLQRELSSEEKQVENKTPTPEFTEKSGDKSLIAGRFILHSFLFNKPYALEMDINDIEFTNLTHKKFKKYIAEKMQKGEKMRFNDLYDDMEGDDEQEISYMAGLEMDENKHYDEAQYFYDCIKTLKKEKIDVDIERLNAMFTEEKDASRRKEIATALAKLLAEKSLYK